MTAIEHEKTWPYRPHFSCSAKEDQPNTRNICVSQFRLCRTPQTRCCVTRGGHNTQMHRVLGVWLVGLELKIPPEHKNANTFAFSCLGGPNTPNTMLCHKGGHDTRRVLGVWLVGGIWSWKYHPNTKTRSICIFMSRWSRWSRLKGGEGEAVC